MDTPSPGLPLLSGQVISSETRSESSCRRCDKEFNMLFTRARKCNHCGYAYCSSCTDYQALMPRTDANGITGYEACQVCAFCIEMLQITASNKSRLKSLPLWKLRLYMKGYNIAIPNGALEKEDLVNIIVKSRGQNGCLSHASEEYYRAQSVPKRSTERQSASSRARNFFSRPQAQPSPQQQQPQQSHQQQQQQQARPQPPPHIPRPASTPPRSNPPPNHSRPSPYRPPPSSPPPSQSRPNSNPPPRPRPANTNTNTRPASATPAPAPAPPPPPTPTLDQLLTYTAAQIQSLSIHSLKAILFENHVHARMAVEKGELVERVSVLVSQERADRLAAAERLEAEEREMAERAEREDQERVRLQHEMMARAQEQEQAKRRQEEESANSSAKPPPPPKLPFGAAERSGLCVICQDEDANIAIVDCGHMCLCRGCSETVMNSTRECPMCRTRIITEARLLRIFKT